MKEIWKDIPETGRKYKVSNLGRVSGPGLGKNGNAILSCKPQNGYCRIGFFKTGNKKRAYSSVHRLVLEAFTGKCPPLMESCHKNGIGSDNRSTNLRWGTKKSNQADRVIHGTHVRGERHPNVKLTEREVIEIRKSKEDNRTAAKKYKISKEQISTIRCGRCWKHLL